MKRCPQCDFVYLDSDSICDLDGNTLLPVDGEPEATTIQNSGEQTESWKWLSLVAVLGTALGAVVFVGYYRFTHTRAHDQVDRSPAVAMKNTQSIDLPLTPESTAAPESSPTPGPRLPATPRTTPVSAKLSSNPVSTTTDEIASGGVTIRLTDGGTIIADEAWSTKQGIWFRLNGVVTLLKRNRVKAIDRGR
jgi:hypothetical protein